MYSSAEVDLSEFAIPCYSHLVSMSIDPIICANVISRTNFTSNDHIASALTVFEHHIVEFRVPQIHLASQSNISKRLNDSPTKAHQRCSLAFIAKLTNGVGLV